MIRMCCAKMSSPGSSDRLTLEIPISESREKVFISEFDGGIAMLSEGITGKVFQYTLYSTTGCGHINLVRNRTNEQTLYADNRNLTEKRDADKSSPVFCSLLEGQILIIECKKTFTRKPLRLDKLTFE